MRRFSETQRMEEEWYCELSLAQRCLFELLWAKADCAGVWSVNKKLAEMYLGEKIEWPKFVAACGGRVVELDEKRYLLRDFVKTNCGELSDKCKAHLPVFKKLAEHGLDSYLGSYSVATEKLQEKDPEQDKDKDERKGMQGETKTPALSEVLDYASSPQGNIPPDVAEVWWSEHEARPRHSSGGYTDKSGCLVFDWKSALRGFGIRWRTNDEKFAKAKPRAGNGEQPFVMKDAYLCAPPDPNSAEARMRIAMGGEA